MNEKIVIAVLAVSIVGLLVITINWWLRAYRDDNENVKEDEYLFDDFYMLSKGIRDEDGW